MGKRKSAELQQASNPQMEAAGANVLSAGEGKQKSAELLQAPKPVMEPAEAKSFSANFMPLDTANDKAALKRARKKGSRSKAAASAAEDASMSVIKSNVIYVGRIPHGFYEEQIRGFFGQFGTITRLRISRNKKTGKSKHYGFIEFESPEVAAIVAESMHNYLLFESMLQVKLVPLDKIHGKMWAGANKRFKPRPFQAIARQEHDKVRTLREQKRSVKKVVRTERQRIKKYEASGIDYEFPSIISQIPPAPKKIKFDDTV